MHRSTYSYPEIRLLKLDSLPEEILTQILALVPYTKEGLQVLGQVCRRFRAIINGSYRSSFLTSVAITQYAMEYHALRFLWSNEVIANNVDYMMRVNQTITSIIKAINKYTSAENTAADSRNWTADLYSSILLYETINQLCKSRIKSKCQLPFLQHAISLDARLAIRYMCAKVARCLRTICILPSKDHILAHSGIQQDMWRVTDWNVGAIATYLEEQIVTSEPLHAIQRLLHAAVKVRDHEAEDEYLFLCESFIDLAPYIPTYGVLLQRSDHFNDDMDLESWFYKPLDPSIRPMYYTLNIQSCLIRMIETTSAGEHPILDFICHYYAADHQKHIESNTIDWTHSLLFHCQQPIRVETHNQRLVHHLRCFRNDAQTGQIPTRIRPDAVYKSCVTSFDWEEALDNELLRGDSSLRMSLPPITDLLTQVSSIDLKDYRE